MSESRIEKFKKFRTSPVGFLAMAFAITASSVLLYKGYIKPYFTSQRLKRNMAYADLIYRKEIGEKEETDQTPEIHGWQIADAIRYKYEKCSGSNY